MMRGLGQQTRPELGKNNRLRESEGDVLSRETDTIGLPRVQRLVYTTVC